MKHLYSRYLRFYSFLFFITFTMLVFTACKISYSEDDEDKNYTVYTYRGSYSEFVENMSCISVKSGEDSILELSGSNWEKAEAMVTNATYGAKKSEWKKESIKAFFLGWGLTNTKADLYVEVVCEKYDHVLCLKRSGDTMVYLIK